MTSRRLPTRNTKDTPVKSKETVTTPEMVIPFTPVPVLESTQDEVMSRYIEGLAIAEPLPIYETYPTAIDTTADEDLVEVAPKKKIMKYQEMPFYGHDYRTKNNSAAVTPTQAKEEMWSHDKFGHSVDDEVDAPKVAKIRIKKQAASATTGRPPLDIQKKYSKDSKHHRQSDPSIAPTYPTDIPRNNTEAPIIVKRTPKLPKQPTVRRESIKSTKQIEVDPAIHTVSEQTSNENYTSRNKHYSLEQPYVDQTIYYPPRSTDSPSIQASSNNSYSPYPIYGQQPMVSATGQIVIMGQDGFMYPATPATMMNFGFTPLSSGIQQNNNQFAYPTTNMQQQQQEPQQLPQQRQLISRKEPVLVRITSSDGKILNPKKPSR